MINSLSANLPRFGHYGRNKLKILRVGSACSEREERGGCPFGAACVGSARGSAACRPHAGLRKELQLGWQTQTTNCTSTPAGRDEGECYQELIRRGPECPSPPALAVCCLPFLVVSSGDGWSSSSWVASVAGGERVTQHRHRPRAVGALW